MFSTKGRYALRAMADLAAHPGWVSLGDLSQRQGISRKYLEQVMGLMHKAGLVQSMRGKNGGYQLTREPSQYTLSEIVTAAEGPEALVACHDCDTWPECTSPTDCPTVGVWSDLGSLTSEYLKSKTLADIA